MFDVINEMRTLSNLSYEELCEIAVKENSPVGMLRPSKVEIITAIIAGRVIAYMDWRDDFAQRMVNKSNSRAKYCIEDQFGNRYYVELTDEQIRFMNWCHANEINLGDCDLYEMGVVEWEAP